MTDGSKPDGPASIPPAQKAAEEDFASLFAASEQGKGKGTRRGRGPRYTVGDRVEGRVVSLGQQVAVVELPDGAEGTLDMVELRDPSGQVTLRVGDTVDARVAEVGEKAGSVTLRRAPMRGTDARHGLTEAAAAGLPVDGLVTAVNKGGLEVTVAGARAFCPTSQIDLRPVADPAALVGQRLSFRITKLEEDRRGTNIVLSRRALLEDEQRARAALTRDKLVVGAVLPGVVTGLKDFGAFVDLGGIDGLLPASEIGYQRGTRPADVLSIGQPVTVQILRIEKRTPDQRSDQRPDPRPDPARLPGRSDHRQRPSEQITLSLKSLERDPWVDAAQTLAPGAAMRGKITRVEPFGAFVELLPGVEGLIHVSELGAGRHLQHARDVAKPGGELEVTVLSIDLEKRRISLGLANGEERVDDEGRAAVVRAAAPTKGMGTLGDLIKGKLAPPRRS
jgi:small subunit ribosomal protein S1